MTLLISCFAALIVSIIWYKNLPQNKYNIKDLCFMFWGASLMWLCDAVFEYLEIGDTYFNPGIDAMVNDTFLGLSIVALALIIWFVKLLINDPENKIKTILKRV